MNLKRIKKDQLGKLIKKYRCDSFVIIVIFFKSNKNYLRIDHISLLDLFILSRHFDIIIIG